MSKTIINSSVYDKAVLFLSKQGSRGTLSNKLKAVISSYNNDIKTVSKVFNVHRTSIYRWSKQISNDDFEGLVNKSKHQDGIKLKHHHKNAIKKWLQKTPNQSIKEVKTQLEENYNLFVSKSTVHYAMKKSGFSYITPRKRHYKQNKKSVDAFKKNFSKK
jgi:transposase